MTLPSPFFFSCLWVCYALHLPLYYLYTVTVVHGPQPVFLCTQHLRTAHNSVSGACCLFRSPAAYPFIIAKMTCTCALRDSIPPVKLQRLARRTPDLAPHRGQTRHHTQLVGPALFRSSVTFIYRLQVWTGCAPTYPCGFLASLRTASLRRVAGTWRPN